MPPQSTYVAWFDDVYRNKKTGETVTAFRCEAFRKTIYGADIEDNSKGRVVRMAYDGTIAEHCIEARALSLDTASKKVGLSATAFQQQYNLDHSNLRGSYDLEGAVAWHKNPYQLRDNLQNLAYNEPECAPNPIGFFYDAKIGIYDYHRYYSQRELSKPIQVHIVERNFPRLTRIQPLGMEVHDDLLIRASSKINASLPVEITWRVDNFPRNPS